jgi:hypothetical protein
MKITESEYEERQANRDPHESFCNIHNN